MIALAAASVMYLTALQSAINAPRQAFWACAKLQKSNAENQKVAPDAFEAFLRNACNSELQSLESAIAAVDVKNGMSHKAASEDASSSINDYLSGPVDSYKSTAQLNAPAAAKPTPALTPASDPQPSSQSPKP
jgi:hypothetical protein